MIRRPAPVLPPAAVAGAVVGSMSRSAIPHRLEAMK